MTDILVVFAIGLIIGFALGYAIRAAITFRHRQAAIKRRYLLYPDLGERCAFSAGGDGGRRSPVLIDESRAVQKTSPCDLTQIKYHSGFLSASF
jgi:hypothetical protein